MKAIGVAGVGRERLLTAELRIEMPAGLQIRDSEISSYPSQDVLCLATGSQGEPMSALSRIAIDDHRHVKVGPDDTVVLSGHGPQTTIGAERRTNQFLTGLNPESGPRRGSAGSIPSAGTHPPGPPLGKDDPAGRAASGGGPEPPHRGL